MAFLFAKTFQDLREMDPWFVIILIVNLLLYIFLLRAAMGYMTHACLKWDLVVHEIFIFSNFVRQYFRFRSVNFFQSFGDN